MIKVALRGIRAHLLQFALAVFAVVLGIAFISGTFALRDMMSATFSDIVETSVTGDAYIRGAKEVPADELGFSDADAYNTIPLTLADDVADLPEVEAAVPEVTGPIVILGADGTAVMQGNAPSMAFGLESVETVEAGSLPSGADEVALESETLRASGLSIGDSTTAIIGGTSQEVTVVGEISFDTAAAGATLAFLDSDFAQDAYASDGLVESIAVEGAPGVDESELATALNTKLDHLNLDAQSPVTAVTGAEHREAATAEITETLGFIEMLLLVFASVSLFVGAFIIANTFAMSVRQRQAEFALLRAIGAGGSHVFATVMAQAAVVGLLGSAIGVGAGVGLVALLQMVFEQLGMPMSGSIPLTVNTIVVSLVIGVIVTVISAILPARRAALTPPVEAMRDSDVEAEKSLRGRGFLGAVALVVGLSLVMAAWSNAGSEAGTLLGLGAIGVVAAMLILAPVVIRPVIAVIARPLTRLVSPGGVLASRNLVRNRRRTATTASALMVGMSLVGAATVIAASMQESVTDIVDDESQADLIVQSAGGSIPSEAVSEISDLATVKHADQFALGAVKVDGESTPVASFPFRSQDQTWKFTETEGSLTQLGSNEVVANTADAEEFDWSVGDTLTLAGGAGDQTLRIGAIAESRGLQGPALFLSSESFSNLIPHADEATHMIFLSAATGATDTDLHADVTEAIEPFMVLSALTNQEFAGEQADLVNDVLSVVYGLLALAIVIAVLGIANTLALSLIDRTKEIGLLRAVGMGRAQLVGVVSMESVLTALFGAILGLAVGVGLAALLPTVFSDLGFTSLVVPWSELSALVAVAVVGGLLAALWPAIRATRLPILAAISAE